MPKVLYVAIPLRIYRKCHNVKNVFIFYSLTTIPVPGLNIIEKFFLVPAIRYIHTQRTGTTFLINKQQDLITKDFGLFSVKLNKLLCLLPLAIADIRFNIYFLAIYCWFKLLAELRTLANLWKFATNFKKN